MTDVEKIIFTQVYSWHMASYQKRKQDSGGYENDQLCRESEEAISYATDAVETFRSSQNEWYTTETSMMLKGLLGESDPPKPSVAQSQQVPDGMGVVLTAGKK
jgi:hypothetical protein